MLTPGFPSGAVRVGMDMVDLDDIASFLERHPGRLDRVFTAAEQGYCAGQPDPVASYAARWCAKEAGMKALGIGWPEVAWTDFEVRMASSGRPRLVLHGRAQEIAGSSHLLPKDLSLTHTKTVAAAVVVFVQE